MPLPDVTQVKGPLQIGNAAGAESAAIVGQRVLDSLKGQPSTTSMSVPAGVLTDLASAVVELAGIVAKLQASQGAVPVAPQGGPRVKADLSVTSVFHTPQKAVDQLSEMASKVRLKCAELGINLNVGVDSLFAMKLTVAGEASKEKLDKVRQYIETDLLDFGRMGKLQVNKYEIV